MSDRSDRLAELARLYGVQLSYRSNMHTDVHARPTALMAILRALGAQVESEVDVEPAIDAWWREHWQRALEPVLVAWEGIPPDVLLHLSAHEVSADLRCTLTFEDGTARTWEVSAAMLPIVTGAVHDGQRYVELLLRLDDPLELGYHTLTVEWAGQSVEALIIAAPRHTYDGTGERSWGAFLPLYALRTRDDWGAGNLTSLAAFLAWARELGGDMVGILPILAAFLEEPFEPSPYAPVSRLFWNEFYVDVTAAPEMAISERARALVESEDVQREITELRDARLVDYRRGFELRRAVLEELAASLLERHSERRDAFWRWVDANPGVRDYARFRAAIETTGATFYNWPERMRAGVLHESDVEPQREHYHLYAQWLASEQLAGLAETARQGGSGLYLDFPLGVHGAGYDVWRWPELFMEGVSVGAPPDPVHTLGQNWGFRPLHPQRLRERGYRYHIDSLRTLLEPSGTLRIDHVMGMRRLFVIPAGMGPEDGVYIDYSFEEMLAILTLESTRYRTLIVGEDLGTVPEEVRAGMTEHNLLRMCVLLFALRRDGGQPYIDVPANSMASLNTHDLDPFATYLMRLDDAEYHDLLRVLRDSGHLAGDVDDPLVLAQRCLEFFAASRARLLMVNLEDLWGETELQNRPGTVDEHPNWRHKAQLDMDAFTTAPEVVDTLRRINALRHA